MRILLVGEYSNLHNSLKSGLMALGHEVILLATGDGFKNYPTDINVRGKNFQDHKSLNLLRQSIYKLSGQDVALLETAKRTLQHLKKLGQFDVIQLINEYPLKTPYALERKILNQLRTMTPILTVLGCGDDWTYLNNLDKLPHHPIKQHQGSVSFRYSEKYLTPKHTNYHTFVNSIKDQVITTDLDYYPAYEGKPKHYGLIPYPIVLENFKADALPVKEKLVIFHGINRINYHKKGNDIFDKALAIIQEKYSDQITVHTVESLPYQKYIKAYQDAHIVLDQAYALDQGYNALEAMAQGKVVFTGAGKAFCKKYRLKHNEVAIHTTPDVQQIVSDLERIIKNPDLIFKIGARAQKFIEDHHDATSVAQQYLKAWQSLTV